MVLLSLGIILIMGFLVGILFEKIRLFKIVGMIIVGMFMGLFILNIIDGMIL